MNTKLIALASAIVATTALASAAEAGGGVRLGFGGPLGTFVATPSHGGGGAYQSPRARKKAPVAQAARKPEIVRAARKPEVVQAARKPDKAPRVAKSEPAPKLVKETTAASKVTEEAATEEAAPVTGSSALIQGSIPVQEQDGAATTQQAAPEVRAEAPSAEQTVTATAPAEQETSGNCKKFIPAVGMTVSVGCPE